MDQTALSDLLDQLIANWENEVVEFKGVQNSFPSQELGKYVSALANEANLRELDRAWLVFGVEDKNRAVVGTSYKQNPDHLLADKKQVRDGTGNLTIRDIHELIHPNGRVLLFEIPAAPCGMPVSWNGNYYGRAGASLVPLSLDKLDELRSQTLGIDWTAQVVDGASLEDIDPAALAVAREGFATKRSNRLSVDEISRWSDEEFLDRARLTDKGGITHAALLLIGKDESTSLLNAHPAQITWKLESEERVYEHFYPPFLLTSSQVFDRLRNVPIRLLKANSLVAREVPQYDRWVVLEALHNCIAHQDYNQRARIIVLEYPDRLTFFNRGGFIEGDPDHYVLSPNVPSRYRNPFLVRAMTELNMIDQIGYGIQSIYRIQQKRFLPLPDYEFNEPDEVRLTIHGHVVDEAYSQLLMRQTGLPLSDVLALDRVQKRLPITNEAVRHLRRGGLIEGRKPNYFISAEVADATSQQAQYIKTRAFDNQHYEDMILQFLRTFGRASRKDIDDLLRDKFSDALDAAQSRKKVSNLLTSLRLKGKVHNVGSKMAPEWRLVDKQ